MRCAAKRVPVRLAAASSIAHVPVGVASATLSTPPSVGGTRIEAGLPVLESGDLEGRSSSPENGAAPSGSGSGSGSGGGSEPVSEGGDSGAESGSGAGGVGSPEGSTGSGGESGSGGGAESAAPLEGGAVEPGAGSAEESSSEPLESSGSDGSSGGTEGTGGVGSSGPSEGGASGGEGGSSSSSGAGGGTEPQGGASGAEPFRFFAPTSIWNQTLPAGAALDPSSAAVVGALQELVAHEEEVKKGPAINTTAWSVPVYTVPANQPTVKVTLAYASSHPTLQAAWEAVPLPADAQPAVGTDKHLVVWQPSTDKLWEFWHLEKLGEGWEAYWGGAIQDASAASGAYGPEAWPGAATSWGASASSLSIAGGLITLEDLEKGTINHALAIAVPNTRAGEYAAPAQRTDGQSGEVTSLPEGAHLRLEPGLDLASLHLPHFTLMLAEAAQKYGIVVRDTAPNLAFYGQDPTPTGANPYTGPHGYYEGKSPPQLLALFPWSHLQLLKMELHGKP